MYTVQGQQHAQRSPQYGRCLENLYNRRNPERKRAADPSWVCMHYRASNMHRNRPSWGKHVQREKPKTKSVFQELIRAGCVYSIVLATGTEITPARTLERTCTAGEAPNKIFFPRDADPNWVCVHCSASTRHRYGPSQDAGVNDCTTGKAPNKIGFSGVDLSRVCLH